MNEIFTKIEKLEPKPSEAIVLRFDASKSDICEVYECFQAIQKAFPNFQTVVIPNAIDLKVFNIATLEDIISTIFKTIEQLKKEKNK